MFIVMVILFWVQLYSILINVQVHLFVIKMINEKNTKKKQFKYINLNTNYCIKCSCC